MCEPEASKTWTIKDIMTLITQSTGSTQGAPAQPPWHMRPGKPALFNWQRVAAHPEMNKGPELGYWQGQLIIAGIDWQGKNM